MSNHVNRDLHDFLSAIETAHSPVRERDPSLERLVEYALGKTLESESLEIERAAASSDLLRARLFETWQTVSDLTADPLALLDTSPATNPFRFEIARHWKDSTGQSLEPSWAGQAHEPVIGRNREMEELEQWLRNEKAPPLVITGQGGVGKSHLLRSIAQIAESAFPGRVFIVDCSDVTCADDLLLALASQLGIEIDDTLEKSVAKALAERPSLLALDKIDGLSDLSRDIGPLMDQAPALRVLGTSREFAGTSFAKEVRLSPLGFSSSAPGDEDAVSLFQFSVQRFAQEFELTARNLPIVKELCRFARGIPLSISIVAGCLYTQDLPGLIQQVRAASPATSRDEGSIGPAVNLSLNLVSQEDRALLRSLCVFAGQFSFEEGRYVCGLPDLEFSARLTQLQRYRLVLPDLIVGEARYKLHDAVGDHLSNTGQKTGEFEQFLAQKRHCEIFATMAEGIGGLMRQGRWKQGLTQFLANQGNLRRAIGFATAEGRSGDVRRFIDGLARTCFEAGFLNDFDLLCRAGSSAMDPRLAVQFLGLRGALASRQGDEDTCTRLWKERLELCLELEDTHGCADTLSDLAWQACELGDHEQSIVYLEEAERLAKDAGIEELVASMQIIRARIHLEANDQPSGRHWIAETEATLEKCRDRDLLPFVYQELSRAYSAVGESERAIQTLRTLMSIAAEGHRSIHVARALLNLAPLYESSGKVNTAAQCHVAALAVMNEYATKDRKRAQTELDEFTDRHRGEVEGELTRARKRGWMAIVAGLLEHDA